MPSGPGYRAHHVPGHCPGLICLQVHDVLLTSDHVLSRITPHQFPQAITPFGGLEHLALDEGGAHVEYLHQLGRLRIANLDDVQRTRDPVIEYVART